jgi:hypothetical protein
LRGLDNRAWLHLDPYQTLTLALIKAPRPPVSALLAFCHCFSYSITRIKHVERNWNQLAAVASSVAALICGGIVVALILNTHCLRGSANPRFKPATSRNRRHLSFALEDRRLDYNLDASQIPIHDPALIWIHYQSQLHQHALSTICSTTSELLTPFTLIASNTAECQYYSVRVPVLMACGNHLQEAAEARK